MSIDLVILPAQPGMTPGTVHEGFDRLEEGESYPFGEPSPALMDCYESIIAVYPRMDSIDDEAIDHSVWSEDPEYIDGFIQMAFRLDMPTDTFDTIREFAHRNGLALWDPQSEELDLPPSLVSESEGSRSLLHTIARLCGFMKGNR